jgi:hypothetical protein
MLDRRKEYRRICAHKIKESKWVVTMLSKAAVLRCVPRMTKDTNHLMNSDIMLFLFGFCPV